MALTGSEFITEVADTVGKALGATSRSGVLMQDRILKFLNFGQERIARTFSFDELKVIKTDGATVADVKRYPLESGTNNLGLTGVKDIESLKFMDGANSRKLINMSARKFDAFFPRPENFSTGRPSMYVRYQREVELFKIPNDAYTLETRYSTWATALANDATVSDFLHKDQLLITSAVLETYMALEEYADAKVWFQRFLGQLSDAVKVEGLVDWEPQADSSGLGVIPMSGAPWVDPYGDPSDPLYGFPG